MLGWVPAWLLGIFLAAHLPFPPLGWFLLACLLAGLIWLTRRASLAAFWFSWGLFLALGAARYTLSRPALDAHALATYNDQGLVTLEGVVIAEPDVRDTHVNLRLRVDRLEREGEVPRPVKGLVLIRAPRFPLYAYGDRLRVTGLLETPPSYESFSYRDYLARQRIYSWIEEPQIEYLSGGHGLFLYRGLLALKAHAQDVLARLLPDPEASLLTGILLGVDTGLPRRLSDNFSATGTTHIIAISGFNISIITGLLMGTLGHLLGRRRATVPTIVAIALYTILVGADAAVVRAALMGVLYVLGRRLNRPTWALNSLAVAALGMTLLDPFILWDVGFQLSVAATVGLVLYTPPLEEGMRRLLTRRLSAPQADRVIGLVSEALLVTMAAQITTTPIILYHFRRLSLVTLLTNFLILPAQQGVMIWGGMALILALVWFPLGQPVAWVAWLFLTYTIRVVEGTARFPLASVPLHLSGAGLVGYYGLLVGVTLWLRQPENRDALGSWLSRFGRAGLALSGTGIAVALVWAAVLSLPDGRLHLRVLDLRRGDALLLQTPEGLQVLINGGGEPTALLSALGQQLPYWDRHLDLVVLTGPQESRVVGAVAALERYGAQAVLGRDWVVKENPAYDRWRGLLAERSVPLLEAVAGQRLLLGSEVVLEVLATEPTLGLRLTYGGATFLFLGDGDADLSSRFRRDPALSYGTLVWLTRRGVGKAMTTAWGEALRPQVVILSVSRWESRRKPPALDPLLERWDRPSLWRTDEEGTIAISTDGRRLWIRPER